MNLIKKGEKLFDELEIQIVHRREISAKAELNQISSATASDLGMAVIRGVVDKKVGISIVDSNDESKIAEGIERAYKIAKLNDRDENWPGFPGRQSYSPKPSSSMEERDADYFVNRLTLVLKEISERKPDAIVVGAEMGNIVASSQVYNSNGVEVSQEDSLTVFVLVMMGRYGDIVTPSIFDMDVRKDSNIDDSRVIDSCLTKLEYAKTVKRAEEGDSKVILEPFALAEIMQFALYPSFSGERKVKGTSMLSGKEGEKIMSENITISDDPFHEMAISRIIADDEGVATRVNNLVENGVFRGFLWNNYWASMDGRESTGNGMRSFRTGSVGIGAHNMVVRPGNKSLEDMISEVKRGYLVSSFQGAHSSNPDTGSISVVANPAFVIENGEITGSTVFMLGGNIYDLLSNVSGVSSELKPVFMMGKGIYPHVLVENVKIAAVSR